MSKPRLFIGSASETREIVDALEAELREHADIERWDLDTFRPGRFTLEELAGATKKVDFAAFVLGQDDKIESRGKSMPSPRDNVVFEAGLFTAVLGRERTYYLVDGRGTKIPSDWAGLGYLTFDAAAERPRDKVFDAARRIREEICRLQTRSHARPEFRILGSFWQFVQNDDEGSVLSLFEIELASGGLRVFGRSWSKDGLVSGRYESRAARFDPEEGTLYYYWRGRIPKDKSQIDNYGIGEATFEPRDPAAGPATTGTGFFSVKPSDVQNSVVKFVYYRRASPEEAERVKNGEREEREAIVRARLEQREELDI